MAGRSRKGGESPDGGNDLFELYEVTSAKGVARQKGDGSVEVSLELVLRMYLPEGDCAFFNADGFSPEAEDRFFREHFPEVLDECYLGGNCPEISRKFSLESDAVSDRGMNGYVRRCSARASLTEEEYDEFESSYDIGATKRYDFVDELARSAGRAGSRAARLRAARRLVRIARSLAAEGGRN